MPLTAAERSVLEDTPFDLGEMEGFLTHRGESTANVASVMKTVEKLASGEGVTPRHRSGTFYGHLCHAMRRGGSGLGPP